MKALSVGLLVALAVVLSQSADGPSCAGDLAKMKKDIEDSDYTYKEYTGEQAQLVSDVTSRMLDEEHPFGSVDDVIAEDDWRPVIVRYFQGGCLLGSESVSLWAWHAILLEVDRLNAESKVGAFLPCEPKSFRL